MYLVDSLIFHGVINLHFVTKNLKECFCFFHIVFCGKEKKQVYFVTKDNRRNFLCF